MDPLTHSLTGVMLARTGLGRLYPRSTLLMILAANAPDIDIVAATGGSLDYLHYHRWITHSVVLLPVMAALTALLICGLRRSLAGFGGAWFAALAAVASHLVLDWTNPYGIRLLSPFSDHWYRGDLTGVIDPFIWFILLAALGAPLLGRLVSSEMGARSGSGRGAALAALLFVSAYDGGRFLLHQRALDTLNARLYDGFPPSRIAAFPGGANPLAWSAWVESETRIHLYELNLLDTFDPAAGREIYKPEPSAAIAAARRTRTFQWFLDFCRFPIWSESPDDETPDPRTRVEVRDARFGFAAVAIVNARGAVVRQGFGFAMPRL